MLADKAIAQLPDYNQLGRLTKLRLNPKDIPNLGWDPQATLNEGPGDVSNRKKLRGHKIAKFLYKDNRGRSDNLATIIPGKVSLKLLN